jgi:hypothetical protein
MSSPAAEPNKNGDGGRGLLRHPPGSSVTAQALVNVTALPSMANSKNIAKILLYRRQSMKWIAAQEKVLSRFVLE